MTGKELLNKIESSNASEYFKKLYGNDKTDSAQHRYKTLIKGMVQNFPESNHDLRIFSAPGRTELGGNHTDHNFGKVLAASIQLDAAALVSPPQHE